MPHRCGAAFDAVVVDSGQGVLTTLERNPRLPEQETDAPAIGLAIQELVSGTGIPTRGIGLWMTITGMGSRAGNSGSTRAPACSPCMAPPNQNCGRRSAGRAQWQDSRSRPERPSAGTADSTPPGDGKAASSRTAYFPSEPSGGVPGRRSPSSQVRRDPQTMPTGPGIRPWRPLLRPHLGPFRGKIRKVQALCLFQVCFLRQPPPR